MEVPPNLVGLNLSEFVVFLVKFEVPIVGVLSSTKLGGWISELKSANSTDFKWCRQSGCVEPRARGIYITKL
jgi:hypothetical protein